MHTENTKSHLNNRICQHCSVKTSTVTPSFYYVFNISLSCNINIPSFIGNLWWVLLLGNHLKGIVRIKMRSKHYQTVDHPKWEPQVGRGLFGIRLLIPHFKFQFSKSIKSSTFHIFIHLTYPLRKNISFPKCPKTHPKTFTKSPNSGNGYKHRDLALLPTWVRYWQKGRVKRRQNSLHVDPRLKIFTSSRQSFLCWKWKVHDLTSSDNVEGRSFLLYFYRFRTIV